MKILFLIDCLNSGGKERRLVELLKGLSTKKNINCELIVMSKLVHYKEIFDLKIKVHFLIRRWKYDFFIIYKIYNICKEFKPNIIQSCSSMTSVYALPIVKLLKIKFINSIISISTKEKIFSKFWIRSKLTFPFSDIIISNSYAGLNTFHPIKGKSICIHNGFDFYRIKNLEEKDKIRKKFNIKTDKVIGMVAIFKDGKDYYTYIKAANILLKNRQDITFLAVGDGKNFKKCERMIKNEFQDNIKFLGRQRNVESIINIFDVGVLITNLDVHGEGISNSIVEYMALGKPAIATCGGGTGELVLDGETGFLIPQRSQDILVEKILYLIKNPDVREEMGVKAIKRIEQKFGLEKMINEYIHLYKRLIKL